ncbi:kinase-like domain-containing protein [Chytridium lagenaria]|nr:kinase-like domain-containing protein [Chytridium lagenaria]
MDDEGETQRVAEIEFEEVETESDAWAKFILMNSNESRQFSLQDGKISYVLGREFQDGDRKADCDIEIPGKLVSARHCRVFLLAKEVGGSIMIEDFSSNGTFVNDKKLERGQKTIIQHGDEISFGYRANKSKDQYYIVQVLKKGGKDEEPETPFARRYDIRQELGRGNFAIVKLAIDRQTGEQCAVKIIDRRRFSMNAKLIMSFNREVEILRSLSHPHVVGYRDYFQENEKIFLVQELVSGGDLLQHIGKKGRLPENEAKIFFHQIMDVLKFLHERKITHRDLKPDNFLLTDSGSLKLGDFGLAKGQTGVLNTVCGTPVYLAPEILKNAKSYDSRVDLYSTGVILFFLLSGKIPFNGGTQTDIFHQIQRGNIDWSDPFWNSCSSEGSVTLIFTIALHLIMRLMNTDPEKRIRLTDLDTHPWICGESLCSTQDPHSQATKNQKFELTSKTEPKIDLMFPSKTSFRMAELRVEVEYQLCFLRSKIAKLLQQTEEYQHIIAIRKGRIREGDVIRYEVRCNFHYRHVKQDLICHFFSSNGIVINKTANSSRVHSLKDGLVSV